MSTIIEEKVKTPLIHARINKKPVNTDSIEAITAEKDRMVNGTFINVECPGQPATICARYYKDQELYKKVFQDGEVATIPLSIARHINERCYFEPHTHLTDEKGNPLKSGKKQPRYKFMAEF